MTPRLWIVAGPNGSGKSTFARADVFERLSRTPEASDGLIVLNPDHVAKQLGLENPGIDGVALSLAAAKQSDEALDQAISRKQSVLVETVLSSDKMNARLENALTSDYWVGLIYVLLQAPELNVRRVAARVKQGGHDVPVDKIRSRWLRSLERLPLFARRVSAFSVWDNSFWGGPPTLLVERSDEVRYVSPEARLLIAHSRTHSALRKALRHVISDI